MLAASCRERDRRALVVGSTGDRNAFGKRLSRHRDAVRWGPLIEADITDVAAVTSALERHRPDLVGHFAAYAYVGESVADPAIYYANNFNGTRCLLDAMRATGTRHLLFSSTCATYGIPARVPIDETHPQQPINPYGWSKLLVEQMIRDYSAAYGLSAVILRYFNAAGCDPEGEIGERHDPETHAIPLAIQAALDPSQPFTVLGTDFQTEDGSAVRDYIHVSDLADGHLLAAEQMLERTGVACFNLGTGRGTSVLELLAAVERVCGVAPARAIGPRRAGDPPCLIAAPRHAQERLGWQPVRSDIQTIVRTAHAWMIRGTGR